MGFLDKLLGRNKEEASDTTSDVKSGAEDMGQKAEDTAKSGAEQAQGMADDAKTKVEDHTPGQDTP